MPIELKKELITDEQVAFYKEHGYIIGPQLFDPEEVEELRREAIRSLKAENDFDCMPYFGFSGKSEFDPDSPEVQFAFNSWWINAKMRALIASGELGQMASRLLGSPEIRLTLHQVIWKSGQAGDTSQPEKTTVGWHQDAAHFNVFDSPGGYVSAWIALQDTDPSNGGMSVIDGSNNWGLIKDSATFFNKDLESLREKLLPEGKKWVEKDLILKAGQMSFHDGLTIHGSRANLSDQPRLSIVFHMTAQGATYNKHGDYNPLGVQMGPAVKHGDPCQDPLFPKMWPLE